MSTPKLVMQPQASKVGWLGSQLPLDGTGDFTITRASTATRINASGLLETVPANVPIIDHTNGCPELVVEPQVTQLLGMTEQFDNAYWSKVNCAIISNATIAPNGTMTADKLYINSLNGNHGIYDRTYSLISNSYYTISVFVKADEISNFGILTAYENQLPRAKFNLISKTSVGLSGSTSAIVALKDNWFLCSATRMATSTINDIPFFVLLDENMNETYLGDGASGLYIWGAQLQTGSVATSYIPNATTGTVTKVADVIQKTGTSSLLGQTEGTIFINCTVKSEEYNSNANIVDLGLNTTNTIQFSKAKLGGKIILEFFANSINIYLQSINSFSVGDRLKIGLKYKSGNIKLYVNGNLEISNTSTFTFTSPLNQINLGNTGVFFGYQESLRISDFQTFATALTDAELLTMTIL